MNTQRSEPNHHRFDVNHHHTVDVLFNKDGLCDTIVTDGRTTQLYQKTVTLDTYNKLVDFFKENDHRYAINMALQKF